MMFQMMFLSWVYDMGQKSLYVNDVTVRVENQCRKWMYSKMTDDLWHRFYQN